MLDENKIKRLSEVFGWPKVKVRQLFSNNPEEIILTFDDALDYLRHGGSYYYSSTYNRVILGVIKTSEQWSKIFDLLADDAIKNDKDDTHISNVFMSKWVIVAREEMESANMADKIIIFSRFSSLMQERLWNDQKRLNDEFEKFIETSADWKELNAMIKTLREEKVSQEIIDKIAKKMVEIIEEAVPKIKDEQELWEIRNNVCLPAHLEQLIIKRLYETMK